jgi:peptide/nickel transport system permease protein
MLTFVERQRVGAICLVVIVIVAAVAAAAPLVVDDPYAIHSDITLQSPSTSHWLGTDEFGRDELSRLVYGARTSLTVGCGSVLAALVIGAVLGISSGYIGGVYDLILQRIVDGMMAIPTLLLALVLAAAVGTSTLLIIVAIGIAFAPTIVRVVRSAVIPIRSSPMIEAARAVGCDNFRIMMRYVTVNTIPVLIVLASAFFARAIIVEASLSFLGVGVPPPEPSWGGMLSGSSRTYLQQAPWLAISPGLALTLTALSLNFLGDAVRDELDPRL